MLKTMQIGKFPRKESPDGEDNRKKELQEKA